MTDYLSAGQSATGTLPPGGNWEIPPSGPGAPPPFLLSPTPTPPPHPPARGAGVIIVGLVLALVLGFAGARQLRSTSSPFDTRLFTPSGPVVTAPSSQSQSQSPSTSGTADLSSSEVASAAAKVEKGVVDIDTVLGFQNGRAAGTGMVLTPSGEVLTNNHVVAGSTKITATVVATGKSYTATVVGTDPTEDVAVIQLQGASGLQTISPAKAGSLNIGDPVIAIGNAGGKGGTPSVVTGSITALNQSITASDENGSNAQRLTGLIETDAPIEPGDSGGPLATKNGEVIGMDSAAEVGSTRFQATANLGYAIPIENAMSIAAQIESGNASTKIHIGLPAFLGVQLVGPTNGLGRGFGGRNGTVPATGGALIAGIEQGTPADSLGLAAGDTITSVNGTAVDSASTLSSLLASQRPGNRVSIGWTDSSGAAHTGSATLMAGPAD